MPYVVGAVISMTVMHVLLFVYDVTMLRECGLEYYGRVWNGGVVLWRCEL